jgi:hypothetical protein
MKLGTLALLLIPFIFLACTESTSSGDDSRGDLVYDLSAKASSITGRCSVYVEDKRITMVFDQIVSGLGTMEYTSTIKLGSSSVTVSDVFVSNSSIFKESMDANCTGLRQEYEPKGGSVTCSSTEVNASMEIASTPAKLASAYETAVDAMKEQCDYYIEQVKASDMVGGDYEPAERCIVDQKVDTLVMLIGYPDRSVAIEAYDVGGDVYMQEIYAGVDAETLEDVCFAYRHDSERADVTCDGSTITYRSIGDNLEDLREGMEIYACPAFLAGATSFEDMWFGE